MENKNKTKKILNNFVVQKYIFVIVLLLLPLLNWLIFWLGVNLSTLGLAFKDFRTREFTWEYFEYFWKELTSAGVEGHIGRALENTLKYFFTGLLIGIPGALFIAFFIYKKIFLHRTFTIIFYLPAILSSVVLVKVYSDFLNPRYGVITHFLEGLHIKLPPKGILKDPATATPAIICYTVWTGFCTNMLLFSGAMSRIPTEVLEAAKLDGIKPFRECMQVIFPMIWPTFSTMLILAVTSVFTASGPILLFDQNNSYNTETISYWIFHMVYGSGNGVPPDSYNKVSAAGLVFTAVGVPIILFVHWLVEKVPDVEY